MTRATRATADAWLRGGRPAIVIEVAEAQGSVPRERGTRMLVDATTTVGTIGGGHLEWKAIEMARRLLHGGQCPDEARFALGPSLGQCCGGSVVLRWSRLDDAALFNWPATPPRFSLQLYGAGHVGRAIARLLANIDCEVDWIDEREAVFPCFARGGGGPALPESPADHAKRHAPTTSSAWPAHIRCLSVDAVEGEVARAPAQSHFLVMTHSHDLDLRITEAILRRGDFAFLGLIGSSTKRARFAHRLEATGFHASLIERMVCPIGIEGLAGKEPEIIALGAVAQLLRGH